MRDNYSIPPGKRRFRALPATLAGLLGLCSLLLLPATALRAANPPTIYQAYVTPGNAPIQGGIIVGNYGRLFFATLGASGINPQVIGLNSSHAQLWNPYSLNAGEKVYGSPSVSPNGTKLYLGTDHGRLICLDTATGQPLTSFDGDGIFQVTGSSDVRIRCTPALNFNNSPQGSQGAVYFHCNDGKLYALNATTGTLLWSVNTGNNGGPPSGGGHEALSSSPVIARSTGRIYVGSADGKVYGFTPAGAEILKVTIGLPIEASLAISEQGWLYGATREQFDGRGRVFAINPQAYVASNPSQAIIWEWLDDLPGVGGTGYYLASPVIDQAGYVYFTQLGHHVYQFHPVTGGRPRYWELPGKLCQTPAINQYGQLFLGASVYSSGVFSHGAFCAIDLAVGDFDDEGAVNPARAPDWTVSQDSSGGSFGEFFGAVLIRATSTGRVYFADMSGRLFYFNSNSPLMAGDWPCFQAGGRRTGYEGSWPFVLAQLPNFRFFGQKAGNLIRLGACRAWRSRTGCGCGSWRSWAVLAHWL